MIRVLYADDETSLLEICTLFLERTGEFAVETVLSGRDALARLEEHPYDAIISDYQMPGMDGITLLKQVRSGHGNIPFILFTGKGREDVVIEAINNGADFYLQKGGDPTAQFAELAHKVRQAVRRRQGEESRRLNSVRLGAMLHLYGIQDRPIREITDYALEAVVRVTGSAIGYLAFLSDDESILTMHSWSPSAFENRMEKRATRYPVQNAGPWAEVVRLRTPVITNDPGSASPQAQNPPEGHVSLLRYMNVPIFDDQRIVMIAGVANKITDYTDEDVHEVSLLMREIFGILSARKREERIVLMAEMLNTAPGSITVHDYHGRFLYANRKTFEMHRYGEEEFMALNLHQLDVPESEARIKERIDQIAEHGVAVFEVAHFRKDGSIIPVEVYAKRVDWGGTPAILSIATEISDRKQMEAALKGSEEKYRIVAEGARDGIAIVQNGKLVYLNPALAGMVGYRADELTGASFIRFVALESTVDLLKIVRRALAGEPVPSIYSTRIRHRDGQLIEIEANGGQILWKGEKALLATIRDVTGQKEMEVQLRESEIRFRNLVETLPDIIWELDREGRFVYMSGQAAAILGFTPDELAGTSFMDRIPEHLRDVTAAQYNAQIAERRPFVTVEVEAQHRDGHAVILEIRSVMLTDAEGNATGLRGIARDISDRKRAESALGESEERFRTLADMLPQIIFEMDTEGRIQYANRQALEMLQVSNKEFAQGVTGLGFIAGPDRPRAVEAIRNAANGSPGKGDEYQILRRDGTTFPGLIFAVPIRQGGLQTGMRGMIVDISNQKRMEAALRETGEKLRILAGITRHDIQNAMMILRAYLAQAQQAVNLESTKKYVSDADSLAQTIEKITAFARAYEDIGGKEPVWLDLARIVREEAAAAGAGAYSLLLPSAQYEVFADRLFSRVFHNLIENTIRYSRKATRISVEVREGAGATTILYEDDGIGIADDDKEKIFEKGYGEGTGLGLFLIRQILAMTGITIRETGERGRGARYEMTVPPGNVRRREPGRIVPPDV